MDSGSQSILIEIVFVVTKAKIHKKKRRKNNFQNRIFYFDNISGTIKAFMKRGTDLASGDPAKSVTTVFVMI